MILTNQSLRKGRSLISRCKVFKQVASRLGFSNKLLILTVSWLILALLQGNIGCGSCRFTDRSQVFLIMQRISQIENIFQRQCVLDYLAFPDPQEIAPVNVLLYGHSFVTHLKDYVVSLPPYMWNLGMDPEKARVGYKGLGGAKLDRLRAPANLDELQRLRPEVVVIEAGTNDLAHEHLLPVHVCDEMMNLVRDIIDCQVREVIVGQVILRGERGMERAVWDFEQKVYEYNHRIEDALQFQPRASFWHHRNLWDVDLEAHLEDGTHLNSLGHKKLYRSIRGAVQSTVNRIRPAWSYPSMWW